MSSLFKQIFGLITGDMTLFGNIVYNYIALGFIGVFSFLAAFRSTGFLYDSGIIQSSSIGSLIHWVIRLIVFLVLFWIMLLLVWLIRILFEIPIWIWLNLVIIGIIGKIVLYLGSQNRSRNNK
jgi:hypothetical protein